MFFDDPGDAFANVARALRPAGRLVMMVWQASERNEWHVAIHRALTGSEGLAAVAAEAPDPFSLADPRTVAGILEAAGFAASPSPRSTSPSTTVRTWPPPSTGSAASRAPTTCWSGLIAPPRRMRWSGCGRHSPPA